MSETLLRGAKRLGTKEDPALLRPKEKGATEPLAYQAREMSLRAKT